MSQFRRLLVCHRQQTGDWLGVPSSLLGTRGCGAVGRGAAAFGWLKQLKTFAASPHASRWEPKDRTHEKVGVNTGSTRGPGFVS